MDKLLEVCMITLGICLCLILYKAIRVKRFTDRILSISMIGIMATAMICILSVYLMEFSLIDVALVFSLLSFLDVVIICYVVTLHFKGGNQKVEDMKEGGDL